MFRNWFGLKVSNIRPVEKNGVITSHAYTVVSLENGRSTVVYSKEPLPGIEVWKDYAFDLEITPNQKGCYVNVFGVKPLQNAK